MSTERNYINHGYCKVQEAVAKRSDKNLRSWPFLECAKRTKGYLRISSLLIVKSYAYMKMQWLNQLFLKKGNLLKESIESENTLYVKVRTALYI